MKGSAVSTAVNPSKSAGIFPRIPCSYILPIAAATPRTRELSGYLARLARTVDEVIVVDGSPPHVFAHHANGWAENVCHIPPSLQTTNGKVAGVITGVFAARNEHVVIADDDVRYRRAQLKRMIELLADHEVVRPQNFFHPAPWHARVDTVRSLLNRLVGGDWPGTLGVRRSVFVEAGGYSGEVLFENLELVRTMQASGGREVVPLDLFVVRRPPDIAHFRSQRVRQAYDEWARPVHLGVQLALLPMAVGLMRRRKMAGLLIYAGLAIGLAEAGRRKCGGASVYPPTSSLWAPAWLAERAITSWMAFAIKLMFGGVKYRSARLSHAATSRKKLKETSETKMAGRALNGMPVVESAPYFAKICEVGAKN